MKTKYISTLIALVAVAISLSSCTEALDVAPDGRVSLDDVFADNDKTGAYLNTCYANMPFGGLNYYYTSRGPVCWSDDAWDADELAVSWGFTAHFYNGKLSSSDNRLVTISEAREWNFWNRYWESIRSCTVFLTRIDQANVTEEINKKRWKAEAHVLRAFYYAELLKWYGCALPVEREPFDLSSFNFAETKRASYHEVVQFIVEDCNLALNTVELPWRITSMGERGRVTRALAAAIKSKMTLYAASTLYNDGNDYWQEAYAASKEALSKLTENGYALYDKVHVPSVYASPDAFLPDQYSALYNEYFTNASMQYSSDPIDKETIYQSRDDQGALWNLELAQGGYKVGTCPSQELVDAFETTDGQPVLNLSRPYADEKHTMPNYNTGNRLYDPNRPYENRDPRFYANIYYNGSRRKAYWTNAEVKGNYVRTIETYKNAPFLGIDTTNTQRHKTWTGYYIRKFLHPFCGEDYQVGAPAFKLYRLAEVYLNLAEAAAMVNRDAEAISAVNVIRQRVGMPDLPAGISHDQLVLRIKNERRVELALEGDRFFDVRRNTAPEGDLSATDKWVGAMEITKRTDGTLIYKRRPVRALARECYTNKFLKLPLWYVEANLMESLTGERWQNPGW